MAGAGLVLVTGGLGFIGGYVARALLDQGRRVAVLTRGQTTSAEMRFVLREHEDGFVTELASVEDLAQLVGVFARLEPETVVHAASNVDVAALFRDPYRAFQTNVTGTLNVYEAARRTGVRRVVDMSSIGVLPPMTNCLSSQLAAPDDALHTPHIQAGFHVRGEVVQHRLHV